jgi:uncharacterized membrane protein
MLQLKRVGILLLALLAFIIMLSLYFLVTGAINFAVTDPAVAGFDGLDMTLKAMPFLIIGVFLLIVGVVAWSWWGRKIN